MPKYADSAEWEDVIPIPQDDGGPHPLAAIAYSDEYSEAMSYLRAVMAQNDFSDRVLELTADIIRMNPSHYTVWLYRAKIILEQKHDLRQELAWLNATSLKHLKNYQIWHHRLKIVDALADPTGEADFMRAMLEKDAKNYHVWSYRQWLVRRFALWDAGELEEMERMLEEDVRNNSAWNHRWFIVFGREDGVNLGNKEIVEREVEFAKAKILLAPQNQSPWNYLSSLSRQCRLVHSSDAPSPAHPSTLLPFITSLASPLKPDAVRSSHALDWLAEIYAQDEATKADARKALELLATRYDPIRKNYWEFRKRELGVEGETAA